MKLPLLLVAAFSLVTATEALGEGLADKMKWKKVDEEMKSNIDGARKACGSKVAVSIDQKSFNKDWNDAISISGSCGNVLEALASVCAKDADSKAAGAKITKVSCKAASIKIVGGSVNFVMDYGSGGMTSAQIETELEKSL